jgi:hypothetical protein
LIHSQPALEEARAKALSFLLEAKKEGEAWFPYKAKGACSLEATAWSLIALRQNEKVSLQGLEYLAAAQNGDDGGWSTEPGAGHSDWTTGPVILSLRLLSALYSQSLTPMAKHALTKGMSHLLDSRVEFFGPTARLLILLYRGPQALFYGRGWPWDPKCFHWVEPTSYCLLALKLPGGPEKEAQQEVVKFADKFVLEHSCLGGGWNHGNNESLGAFQPPFRLTTAEALLALQDNPRETIIEQGLSYLKGQSQYDSSSLSLAVSILALSAYDEPFADELAYLLNRQAEDGSFGPNTLTTALAALALESAQGTKVLKMKAAPRGSLH